MITSAFSLRGAESVAQRSGSDALHAEGLQPSFRDRRFVLLTAQGRLSARLPQIRMEFWHPTGSRIHCLCRSLRAARTQGASPTDADGVLAPHNQVDAVDEPRLKASVPVTEALEHGPALPANSRDRWRHHSGWSFGAPQGHSSCYPTPAPTELASSSNTNRSSMSGTRSRGQPRFSAASSMRLLH